jgi:hypothetical protein
MNIPTAKEFLKKLDEESGTIWTEDDDEICKAFIEFAKLHVEQALKAVGLNVKLLVDNNQPDREPGEGEDLLDYYECGSDTIYVFSASILEAYPLTNIK